jgi:hypothetical protein
VADRGRRGVELGRRALAQDAQHGQGVGQERGLRVLRLSQLLRGPFEHELGEAKLQRLVHGLEGLPGLREGLGEVLRAAERG